MSLSLADSWRGRSHRPHAAGGSIVCGKCYKPCVGLDIEDNSRLVASQLCNNHSGRTARARQDLHLLSSPEMEIRGPLCHTTVWLDGPNLHLLYQRRASRCAQCAPQLPLGQRVPYKPARPLQQPSRFPLALCRLCQ